MRTAGIEHASSSGELSTDEVALMSKHRGERLFDLYLIELSPAVMV
jgi:hypothetical protein